MAAFAFGGQSAEVNVILLVARITISLGVLIGRTCMAAFAGHRDMQAGQRKPGERMVENHILTPGGCLVATLAFLPELPRMNILFLVAIEAGGRQF